MTRRYMVMVLTVALVAVGSGAQATDCTSMKGCMKKSMSNGKDSFYKGGMAFMDGNQAGVKGFQQGMNKGQNQWQKSMGPKNGNGGGPGGAPGGFPY